MTRSRYLPITLAFAMAISCGDRGPAPQNSERTPAGAEAEPAGVRGETSAELTTRPGLPCDTAAARDLAERFGERLNQVSHLAPDSIVRGEIIKAYAPLVTAELLDRWLAQPESAPG